MEFAERFYQRLVAHVNKCPTCRRAWQEDPESRDGLCSIGTTLYDQWERAELGTFSGGTE